MPGFQTYLITKGPAAVAERYNGGVPLRLDGAEAD